MSDVTQKPLPFVFFGTPEPAVEILERLKKFGYLPSLIVTNPDAPRGRKLVLTPPPAKEWARRHGIPVLQPDNLSDPSFNFQLTTYNFELFIVVAYGKIIPKNILHLPKRGSLNIHYSLLPKYRGATPVETQILNDDMDLGVSIMLLDEKMDHGPIVAQQRVEMQALTRLPTSLRGDVGQGNENYEWPIKATELRTIYNDVAGKLLVKILPDWTAGKIEAKEQDHTQATYTKKISAEDRLIDLSADPYKNFLKIQALEAWGTYFFEEKNGKKIRVKIKDAAFENDTLILKRVIPENKKEISYSDFLRGS